MSNTTTRTATRYVVTTPDGVPAETPYGPARPQASASAARAAYECAHEIYGPTTIIEDRGLIVTEVTTERRVHESRPYDDREDPYSDGARSSQNLNDCDL